MAIRGYLKEIKFVELLRIAGKLNGKLRVWDFQNKSHFELVFLQRNLVQVSFNGKALNNEDEVKVILLDLINDAESYYSFQEEDIKPNDSSFIISLPELLKFCLSNSTSSSISTEELPDLRTVFETVNKIDFPLQGELETFWKDSLEMLHKGCCGLDIYNTFTYTELQVQESLYKLCTIGLIKPKRVFSSEHPITSNRFGKDLNKIAQRFGIQPNNSEGNHSLPQTSRFSTNSNNIPETVTKNNTNSHQTPVLLNREAILNYQKRLNKNLKTDSSASEAIPHKPLNSNQVEKVPDVNSNTALSPKSPADTHTLGSKLLRKMLDSLFR